MSFQVLQSLFRPRSVAVIGASARPQHLGHIVMRNLLAGGFVGPVMPVNPRHESIAGVLSYPDVASLPRTPDLAIICTRPSAVPALIESLGARGTRTAIIMAADLRNTPGPDGRMLEQVILEVAHRYGMRLLGGSSLGVMVPSLGFNATFSHVAVRPGPIGFVSQSDAVGTLVLDWATSKKVGFSHFVSLGDSSDIGFAEVLDYLAHDTATRAILLYIEAIRDRRSFMAAARAAASKKPVLAIKAGRSSHNPLVGIGDPFFLDTNSLVGNDDVYDAVLHRTGILRVNHIDELFGAVETLVRSRPLVGDRLIVVSNGGGAGVMAEDVLHLGGYTLPSLAPETVSRLRWLLPQWNGINPVDIRVDATPQRYTEVLKVLHEERAGDVILVIHTPVAMTSSVDTAQAVIEFVDANGGNLLTSWVGDESVAIERRQLAEAGIASFDSPPDAARAFLHMLNHRRNLEALRQTPPSVPVEFTPDADAVRAIIRGALTAGRTRLAEPEAKAVLAAYGIAIVPAHLVATPEEAATVAATIGFPVVLTVSSLDVRRKWDVGGVALNLETPEAVASAARGMIERLRERKPELVISGFAVQPMVARGDGRQLIVGVATDPLFGPVILFGEGGRGLVISRDLAIGLPPLNIPLARDLISQTRAAALLHAHHGLPAVDLEALALVLTQVSQLVVDHPEIVELEINPLIADHRGVVAVDSHIRLSAAATADPYRLAIRPYPKALEEAVVLRNGRKVLFRPIRAEDELAHYNLMSQVTPEDIRFRFFRYLNRLPHTEMVRLTQIDYDREMAFIATAPGADGVAETLGVVRTVADPDNHTAEFSILNRSDLKGLGLGSGLLRKMIAYCRSRGTRRLIGEVLAENRSMLQLARSFGFTSEPTEESDVVRISLWLDAEPAAAPDSGMVPPSA